MRTTDQLLASALELPLQFYRQRQPRERLLIGAGAVLLLLVALFRTVLPVLAGHWQAHQQVAALHREVAALSTALAARQQLPGDCAGLLTSDAGRGQRALTEAANRAAITLRQPPAGGDDLWLASAASGDALLHFALQTSSCLGWSVSVATVAVASLDSDGGPSLSSQFEARLKIAAAPQFKGVADGR